MRDETFMCVYSQLQFKEIKCCLFQDATGTVLQVVGTLIQKVHSCALASLNFFRWCASKHLKGTDVTQICKDYLSQQLVRRISTIFC